MWRLAGSFPCISKVKQERGKREEGRRGGRRKEEREKSHSISLTSVLYQRQFQELSFDPGSPLANHIRYMYQIGFYVALLLTIYIHVHAAGWRSHAHRLLNLLKLMMEL